MNTNMVIILSSTFVISLETKTYICFHIEDLSVTLCPRSIMYFTNEVALSWSSASDSCTESGGSLARAVSDEEAYMLQAFM